MHVDRDVERWQPDRLLIVHCDFGRREIAVRDRRWLHQRWLDRRWLDRRWLDRRWLDRRWLNRHLTQTPGLCRARRSS